jgi:hypothetical protein
VWSSFGYTPAYLDGMKSQSFWDAEYERISAIDAALGTGAASDTQ